MPVIPQDDNIPYRPGQVDDQMQNMADSHAIDVEVEIHSKYHNENRQGARPKSRSVPNAASTGGDFDLSGYHTPDMDRNERQRREREARLTQRNKIKVD